MISQTIIPDQTAQLAIFGNGERSRRTDEKK